MHWLKIAFLRQNTLQCCSRKSRFLCLLLEELSSSIQQLQLAAICLLIRSGTGVIVTTLGIKGAEDGFKAEASF